MSTTTFNSPDTVRYMLAFFKEDELCGCRRRAKEFHISLNQFGRFLGHGQPLLTELTPSHFSRCFDWLVRNGVSPELAKQHQSRLHRLLRYAIRNQYIAAEGGA